MKSDVGIDSFFKSQLITLHKNQIKKNKHQEKKGIAKYLVDEDDSGSEDGESNDSLNDDEDDLSGGHYLGGKSIMKPEDNHPSKLIDLELLNLLKFCGELNDVFKLNNEDYQEEIMMNSIELGKKLKQKVLVLDMDETMVAARFRSHLPPGFQTTFTIDF